MSHIVFWIAETNPVFIDIILDCFGEIRCCGPNPIEAESEEGFNTLRGFRVPLGAVDRDSVIANDCEFPPDQW